MDKFIHLPNDLENYYILSDDIKVFPTAYRGKTADSRHINIESMLSTESTLRHLSPEFTKQAYIINWAGKDANEGEGGLLCCYIGGYYFEIKIKESDLTIDGTTYNKLWIYTTQKPLSGTTTDDIEYTSKLGSWKESEVSGNSTEETVVYDDILDYCADITNDIYYFTGLKFSNTAPTGTETNAIYYLNLGNSDRVNSTTIHYTKIESNADRSIAGSIYDGFDTNFNRVQGAIVLNSNGNSATGQFSIAGGNSTIAEGKQSLALGYDTQTDTAAENSVVLGLGTIASNPCQLVFGKYNAIDAHGSNPQLVEIVGWGSSGRNLNRKNIRTLDSAGNEILNGNLIVDSLFPHSSSTTKNIGASDNAWNQLYVNNITTTKFSANSDGTIFSGTADFSNSTIKSNLIPNSGDKTLGNSSSKWASAYITTVNSTTVNATTFNGSLSGNATSATKATKDGSDNVITKSYGTSLSHPKDSGDNDIMNQISLMDNEAIKTALNTITVNDVDHATKADNDSNGNAITSYAHVKYGTGTTSSAATTNSNLKITRNGNTLYIWTDAI